MVSSSRLKRPWSLIVAAGLLVAALVIFIVWRLIFVSSSNDMAQNLLVSMVTIILVIVAMWVGSRARRQSRKTDAEEKKAIVSGTAVSTKRGASP